MIIENLIVKNNELMDAGNLDEQIIRDLKIFLCDVERHQKHLDKIKDENQHTYPKWTSHNVARTTYVQRLLEMFEKGLEAEKKSVEYQKEKYVWKKFYKTFNDDNDSHCENAFQNGVSFGEIEDSAKGLQKANKDWFKTLLNRGFVAEYIINLMPEAAEYCCELDTPVIDFSENEPFS